jgi:hypothetical protein
MSAINYSNRFRYVTGLTTMQTEFKHFVKGGVKVVSMLNYVPHIKTYGAEKHFHTPS